MAANEVKVHRKACANCTKAKAKCHPSPSDLNVCHRCERLRKICVHEESLRRKRAVPRSRIKQLERKVESLVATLASHSQNNTTEETEELNATRGPDLSSERSKHIDLDEVEGRGKTFYMTPQETPERTVPPRNDLAAESKSYDPVDSGLISLVRAAKLLKEFRLSFVESFPFVVLTPSTTFDSIRRQQPFLFHAIMTVMAYSTPSVQQTLAIELKAQIADRVFRQSQKSLEILQGLLVYMAWYHMFFQPRNHDLTILSQLCVALVIDLGLLKNTKDRGCKVPRSGLKNIPIELSSHCHAEKRAVLGTFYLNVAISQAWRKPSTMMYTKYMTRCHRSLSEDPEYPSDRMIAPLIQLSELLCRVNNFYSYDSIDDAEVRGESMLEISSASFRVELERLRGSVPPSLQNNATLNLNFSMLEMWIHENSLHATLWKASPNDSPAVVSVGRIKMLYHTMTAMQNYLSILIDVPVDTMYRLSFSCWTGWFYACVVACKLVFLLANESLNQCGPEGMQSAIRKLVDGQDEEETANASQPPSATNWHPMKVAKESKIKEAFEKMQNKIVLTMKQNQENSESCNRHQEDDEIHDPLVHISCLQNFFCKSFAKRINHYMEASERIAHRPGSQYIGVGTAFHRYEIDASPATKISVQQAQVPSSSISESQSVDPSIPTIEDFQAQSFRSSSNTTDFPATPRSLPLFLNAYMNWNSMNFESLSRADLTSMQEPSEANNWEGEDVAANHLFQGPYLTQPSPSQYSMPDVITTSQQQAYEDVIWDFVMNDFAMPQM